ncbi:hypothetical protein [Acinetobacter beijerinckii]|uniref:Lipoprotein n=1 Tax=Acinetobacter beijerinckii ANC 3835 TaxID=1217649 RepID=N9FMX6_9GAMM|nr:hypothetical protein [Acinetobacter beijerinckii]ENW08670.1 hypothetical protein F934_00267 [Acinetobacter beijerinckii ANC 3835]
MKRFCLSLLLCSATINLIGCGENFLAANVSLGGSGSGTQKPVPGGNDNSSNPSTGDGDEHYEYVAKIPTVTQSTCSGVQRRMRFIYADNKQPIPPETIRSLAISPLQIEIENTTPNYVYALTPLCRQIDYEIGTMNILPGESLKCAADQDSIQVLKPFEIRRYEVDLKFAETQEPITVNYYSFYSTDLPKIDTVWDKCEAAQITVIMQKRLIPKVIAEEPTIQLPITEAEPMP